ncbi:MAG: hypothetical protein GY853_02655 [PVC group bacterium]|nr:hypothetical protein [PVC group bacterium]
MDYNEEVRLQKVYEEELSDEALLEMAVADEQEYQDGVYALILKAIDKRGLKDQLAESRNHEVRGEEIDGKNWIDLFQYSSEVERGSLEAFFKEFGIVFKTFPQITRLGVPTGTGIIKVREDCIEQAEKIVADFENAKEFQGIVMEESIVRNSVSIVLERRGVVNPDQIIDEIIEEIKGNNC